MQKTYFKAGTKINNLDVNEAIVMANRLFNDEEFFSIIQGRGIKFLYSNLDGGKLVELIRETELMMEVFIYRSRNPWSRALGYFDASKPRRIHLNSRRLNRSLGSITATLVHEFIHALDNHSSDHYFHHGTNNWSYEKENTAPYWIDNMAEIFVNEGRLEGFGYRLKSINKGIATVGGFVWWNPFTWPIFR